MKYQVRVWEEEHIQYDYVVEANSEEEAREIVAVAGIDYVGRKLVGGRTIKTEVKESKKEVQDANRKKG